MQRLFLIGYMGAGKTTIGKALSRQNGRSFIDLDHFIEGRYHKAIRQIFEEKGEDYFREIEKKALHEVSDFEDVIISTGGGTPCFFDNMAFMNEVGTTIYLKASPDELAKRLELCKHTRPVLQNRSGEELKQFIEDTLSRRSPFYEQAKIIFDAEIMVTEKDVESLTESLQKIIADY